MLKKKKTHAPHRPSWELWKRVMTKKKTQLWRTIRV